MRSLAPATLTVAYVADLAFGDPEWLPHPVRLMGRFIESGERQAKPGKSALYDAATGAALSTLTIAAAYGAGVGSRLHWTSEAMLTWTTLATGNLLCEASGVLESLQSENLEEARLRVSRIVGRDTANLDAVEVARAVIETLAESLCDGVVAPLCYLALGGTPLAMAYKAINTLDSMIGHSEPPYKHFGRFAARLDDGANFVPARLTAMLLIAAALIHGNPAQACKTWLADRHKHPSPNAGQSEAAMAGALRVCLGGVNYYNGVPSRKPVLGRCYGAASVVHIGKAIRLTRMASFLAFVCAFAYTAWRRR